MAWVRENTEPHPLCFSAMNWTGCTGMKIPILVKVPALLWRIGLPQDFGSNSSKGLERSKTEKFTTLNWLSSHGTMLSKINTRHTLRMNWQKCFSRKGLTEGNLFPAV